MELPISVEVKPSAFSMGESGVVLIPQANHRKLPGGSVNLNGSLKVGEQSSNAIHSHTILFGEEGVTDAVDYSIGTFELT
jgi:hypothetical protein